MKLAILMDPIDQLKPYKDTTVAMLKSAQELQWHSVFFTLKDLFCRDGQAFARTYSITIGDEYSEHWAQTQELGEQPLTDFDIIFNA